jgi:membrane-associated protease RseP (regulator of RpoE activity)
MFDEKENFEGEKKIAEMLSGLMRVDAPGDFGANVRARIAREEASERVSEGASAWATNLVRVGAPIAAAIILALGGYFVFTSINTRQNDVPEVAEVQPVTETPMAAPSTPPATNDDQAEERTVVTSSDEMMGDKINAGSPDGLVRSEKNKTVTNANTGRPTGGSTDMAVSESQKIYPRGLNPNAKAPAVARGVDPNARISVSQIFEFIGVKAAWTGDGWRVESVDAGTIAGRLGIKPGDVIEALNEKRVEENSSFPAKFDGKSVRVRRDGASLSFDFKP